jgi:hypothetical protein
LDYSSYYAYVGYLFEDSNHGSDIISHHLQYRDAADNVWVDVVGNDGDHNLATLWTINVQKGTYYELRFRVKNSVDWSQYSPIQSFIAADVPSQPLPLTLVSVDRTYITVQFDLETV